LRGWGEKGRGKKLGERGEGGVWYTGGMKAFIPLLLLLAGFALGGCVNQSIAARRSDIPWNQPSRSEATAALPLSLSDGYDD